MRRVDFFIIGVQKGGTTALDAYLRHHPQIGMGRMKEVHFFDDESLDWSNPDYDRLHSQFDWTGPQVFVRGEATPIYIYWPPALPRLQRYNPNAKLIMGIRHPVFRAYSAWRMERMRGAEDLTFQEAISEFGRSRVRAASGGVHRVYSYIERGLYAVQIGRLLQLFAREQVLFLRTDQLWNDPCTTLTALESFLGVSPHFGRRLPREYIAPINSAELRSMPSHLRPMLQHIFHRDIEQTAELIGLDLSEWLRLEYQEPMQQLPADSGLRSS